MELVRRTESEFNNLIYVTVKSQIFSNKLSGLALIANFAAANSDMVESINVEDNERWTEGGIRDSYSHLDENQIQLFIDKYIDLDIRKCTLNVIVDSIEIWITVNFENTTIRVSYPYMFDSTKYCQRILELSGRSLYSHITSLFPLSIDPKLINRAEVKKPMISTIYDSFKTPLFSDKLSGLTLIANYTNDHSYLIESIVVDNEEISKEGTLYHAYSRNDTSAQSLIDKYLDKNITSVSVVKEFDSMLIKVTVNFDEKVICIEYPKDFDPIEYFRTHIEGLDLRPRQTNPHSGSEPVKLKTLQEEETEGEGLTIPQSDRQPDRQADGQGDQGHSQDYIQEHSHKDTADCQAASQPASQSAPAGNRQVTDQKLKQIYIARQNIIRSATSFSPEGNLSHTIVIDDMNSAPFSTQIGVRNHIEGLAGTSGLKTVINIQCDKQISDHAKERYEQFRRDISIKQTYQGIVIRYPWDTEAQDKELVFDRFTSPAFSDKLSGLKMITKFAEDNARLLESIVADNDDETEEGAIYDTQLHLDNTPAFIDKYMEEDITSVRVRLNSNSMVVGVGVNFQEMTITIVYPQDSGVDSAEWRQRLRQILQSQSE